MELQHLLLARVNTGDTVHFVPFDFSFVQITWLEVGSCVSGDTLETKNPEPSQLSDGNLERIYKMGIWRECRRDVRISSGDIYNSINSIIP